MRKTSMRSRDVYLFRIFLDHDETRGTSVSYDFSNSWANGRVTFLFTIVRLNIQIVIKLFFTTKSIVFEVKTGILCNKILLDHHNNVLIVFFYTCRSAQLNVNGRVREQECIKCLISKMRLRLTSICFPHSELRDGKLMPDRS